jgi:hypothetical protein
MKNWQEAYLSNAPYSAQQITTRRNTKSQEFIEASVAMFVVFYN